MFIVQSRLLLALGLIGAAVGIFFGVKGAVVDYVESLQGAGFKVDNPNVIAACGCGSSFRVADEEEVSAV